MINWLVASERLRQVQQGWNQSSLSSSCSPEITIDWLVASERDGGRLSEVGSRKSSHGQSVAVKDSAVIDILEDKTINLQNEDGFGFASLLFGYFYGIVKMQDLSFKD
nr:hypothetical protein CFP56_64257 [Quercus suber]